MEGRAHKKQYNEHHENHYATLISLRTIIGVGLFFKCAGLSRLSVFLLPPGYFLAAFVPEQFGLYHHY
jgi:hypothetical protein